MTITNVNITYVEGTFNGTLSNSSTATLFTNEYFELFKDSELKIIPNAGLFISVEKPQLYIKTILDFLNK